MEADTILQIPVPFSADSFFERILEMGWYDGITDGLVCGPSGSFAFKFDILAWGPGQDQRIFALAPISIEAFDEVVSFLSRLERPEWPRWSLQWPSDPVESRLISQQLDQFLANVETPSHVIETDSMFKTIQGARQISSDYMKLIPSRFDGSPHLDNYDLWHKYVGLFA
jgi:hypothetical protein